MKKLLLSVVVALGAISISAQEAGNMWVGGTVGFNYVDQKVGGSQTSFKILPEIGYIVSDEFAVGASLGYVHLEGTNEFMGLGAEFDDANGFTISPFLRYSFLKGSLGSLFIDTGAGYSYLEDGNGELTFIEAGFKPGVAIAISPKFSLIGKFGHLGYQHAKVSDGSHERKASAFGFDFDLKNIQIGAVFNF